MPANPLSDKGFRAFPPEVRKMIFEAHLAGVWNGTTPALIKALRRSELYLEALDVLAKTNTFKLHEGNGWSTRNMGTNGIKNIRTLMVYLK